MKERKFRGIKKVVSSINCWRNTGFVTIVRYNYDLDKYLFDEETSSTDTIYNSCDTLLYLGKLNGCYEKWTMLDLKQLTLDAIELYEKYGETNFNAVRSEYGM